MTQNHFADNQQFSAAALNAILNAHDSEGVISGCVPSKGTGDWDVDVASGEVEVDPGERVDVSSGTVTLSSADATNPRVDIVTVDSNGTVSATAGSAAADPVTPDIPTNEVLVCAVFLDGGVSSITSGDIYDYRVLLSGGPQIVAYDESLSFDENSGSTGGTVTNLTSFDVTGGFIEYLRLYARATASPDDSADSLVRATVTWEDATTTTFEVSENVPSGVGDTRSGTQTYNSYDIADQLSSESFGGRLVDTVDIDYSFDGTDGGDNNHGGTVSVTLVMRDGYIRV